MKAHLSLFYLAVRSNFWQLAAVLGLMTISQGVVYWLTLSRTAEPAWQPTVAAAGLPLFCGLGFLLLCAQLCYSGKSFPAAALGRLPLDQRWLLLWQGLTNALCLLIFWAWQGGLLLLFYRLYQGQAAPALLATPTLFLSCYQSPFIHSLLPLADASRWLRNLLLLPSLGLACACFSASLRQKKLSLAAPLLVVLTWLLFCGEMGQGAVDTAYGLFALVIAGIALFIRLRKEKAHAPA